MVNKKRGADFKLSERTKNAALQPIAKPGCGADKNKSSPTLLRARELCGAQCALAGVEGFEHLV